MTTLRFRYWLSLLSALLLTASAYSQSVQYADTANMLVPYLRKSDTANMVNKYLRKTDSTQMLSGYARTGNLPSIAGKVNYTDTLAMLVNYLRKTDTTGMLLPYLRKTDTASMISRYLRKTDSTQMLSGYARTGNLPSIAGKVNYTDTLAMLVKYLRKTDTTGMLLPYLRKTDTASMISRYLRKTDTTLMLSGYARTGNLPSLAGKVNYTDTLAMLVKYLRKTDTTDMLIPYLRKTDTASMISRYLRKTDTSQMLSGYLRTGNLPAIIGKVSYTDTLSMLLNYLRKSDTTQMLGGYARTGNIPSISGKMNYTDTLNMLLGYLRKGDTSQMLSGYLRLGNLPSIAGKMNYADTLAMLQNYLRKTDTAFLVAGYLRKSDTATMLKNYMNIAALPAAIVANTVVPSLQDVLNKGNVSSLAATVESIKTNSPTLLLNNGADTAASLSFVRSLTGDKISGTGTAYNNYFGFHGFVPQFSGAGQLQNSSIVDMGQYGIHHEGDLLMGGVSIGAAGYPLGFNRPTTFFVSTGTETGQGNWGFQVKSSAFNSKDVIIGANAYPGFCCTVSTKISSYNYGTEYISAEFNPNGIYSQYGIQTAGNAIFGGTTLINTTTNNGIDKLQVNGSSSISGNVKASSFVRVGGTASQYLMADGSISTLPSYMGGSGTVNYIPKFTSVSGIGNSQLFDNGTAVGIGTLTPTTALQVGNGTGNPEIKASGLNYDVLLGTPHGSALGFSTVGNFVGVYTNSATKDLAFTHGNNRAVTFGTGNQSRLTITASGRLLANTRTDNGVDALQVNGSAIASVLKFNTSGQTINISSYYNSGGGKNIWIGGGGLSSTSVSERNTSLGVDALLKNTSGYHNLAIGTEALKENTTGFNNIGIGSTALLYNKSGSGNTALGHAALYDNTTGSSNTGIGWNAMAYNKTGSNNVAIGDVSGGRDAANNVLVTVNNSVFIGKATKASAQSNTNEIVIGFEAIGNGSNTVTLGNSSITKSFLRGTTLINTTTDNGLDKLQVNGSGRFTSSLTANSFIKIGGTSTQYLMADGSISTLPSYIGGSGTVNYIPKFTSVSGIGNSQLFDNGTAVGIGTLTPTTALQVGNGTGNPEITASGLNYDVVLGTPGGFALGFTLVNNFVGVYTNSSTKDLAFTHGNNRAITFGTGNQSRLTITASGRLLANTRTDNGVDALQVAGSGSFTGRLTVSGTAAFGAGAPTAIDGTDGRIITDKFRMYNSVPASQYHDFTSSATSNRSITIPNVSGTMLLGTGTTNYIPKFTNANTVGNSLIFDDGTNVGIGSTNPQANLSIKSGSNVDAEINSLPDGISIQSYNRTSSAYGDISFLTNASGPSLLINNEGQVCIGCTTRKPAAYKLAVEGGIAARSLRITQTNPWADYVFDKKYQLKPLDEVEKYVQQNHHLPDMPSAATVAAEGIDVADIQSKLLSKIEELTLYVIELKKEVDALKKNQPKKTRTNK